MQTLRTAIGLTHAGLAKHLGVSRKAVGEWEAGLTYPKAEHLLLAVGRASIGVTRPPSRPSLDASGNRPC
jgi:DNA-binding XRE family transcriptional regulator